MVAPSLETPSLLDQSPNSAPTEGALPPLDDPDTALAAGPTSRRNFLAGGIAAAAALVGGDALAFGSDGDPVFRIHPAIGIARVGNADPDTYFIGPEIPGQRPLGSAPGTAVPSYKVDGKIKPQAVRFRIFEYRWINGKLTLIREVTLDTPGVLGITWSAHLANKKASFHKFYGTAGEKSPPGPLRNASVADRRSLEIDFGPRSISGVSEGPVEFRAGTSDDPTQEACPLGADGNPVIDYLGQLRTDDEGRLIVLGGQGKAGSNTATPAPLPSYANNDGWFDDISDGPVTATVTIQDGNGSTREIPVDGAGGAWVLVGPPDFAPDVTSAVTLYDILYDMAVRELPVPLDNALYDPGGPLARLRQLAADYQPCGPVEFPHFSPDFTTEIRPMFARGGGYRWVIKSAGEKHGDLFDPTVGDPSPQYAKMRKGFFGAMRAPNGAQVPKGKGNMPLLLGDDPYNNQAPEYVQHLAFTRTQFGLLRNWANGQFVPGPVTVAPATITAHGLDRAQLEAASGGAFFPGIEVGWQVRNAALFIEPFRIDLQATSGYWGEDEPIGPGHFSRQMALPWHADFTDCAAEGNRGWWPSIRPDDVFPSAQAQTRVPWARATSHFGSGKTEVQHEDMVENWYKFGFVVRQPDKTQIETERAPHIP
ncbi:LodA/GoxA family CTQ-dependent oxidase [Polyangium jinanense]|uniref:LodA/GoxA family CTQ-dependent oxidase n=1 Tax=Polyangium jinanense TaxID=2829994 RepID=A0A9X3XID8_9BACT|nr:LodA/GoxA family CTQ-dependent oxidase [Polyangium jinanense]MDC3962206.1 LodA/GoxA family CTQ-dependent oxidase [Polyangium jinanense]MDC3988751.1 LodA/GoxA family CTQ-dependent oxidase [Polyangium jinanense]